MKGGYSPVTKHIVLAPLQSVYRRMQGYDYDEYIQLEGRSG